MLKQELGDLAKLRNPAHAPQIALAEAKARAFVSALYKRVPVLDSVFGLYIHVLRDGWGPYPRSRREILGLVNSEQEQEQG